ncbi:MAG: carbamoyltransferase [Myxococcales bacterium]|nr:carbamoyltransferase [Myxococcota bacterium]MDW8282026.1 carbamoyltransferase [Myxococcales bacterium]
MVSILGLSAFYHDSAACLVQDGQVVAAAQEERFSRRKHDPRFPSRAAAYCLSEAGLKPQDLDLVVFYDKPLTKFERLLETYLAIAPRGFRSYARALPLWIKEKLWMGDTIRRELGYDGKVLFGRHHESHAASAFFASPFAEAAVVTADGVGEWETTTVWHGQGATLTPLLSLDFPHSLGLLYSAFTYYTGFKVNSGEYKVMGLAPYGQPRYVKLIRDHLIDIAEDGSFRLNLEYFDFAGGLRMTNERFHALFGGPPREPESPISQREMDLARSIQEVTEEVMVRLCRHAHERTGSRNLCLAGGVALNCVANGRVLREGPFGALYIQPAAGDAGGAVGAALGAYHMYLGRPRTPQPRGLMGAAFLGPRYEPAEIRAFLDAVGARYEEVPPAELPGRVADLLAAEAVVGWFQGRMEFGPRALGARSILGDPRSPRMQATMNLKIKFRESFRPFAPMVLRERAAEYFDLPCESPYMLLVAPVRPERRRALTAQEQALCGFDQLRVVRSDIPAVTHVDYSARVQTVAEEDAPLVYALLRAFEARTGCPVLVNTSFNVRGEPIVCRPQEAYRCFQRTQMDYLVLENFLLDKRAQPTVVTDDDWRREFPLD